MKRVLLSVLPVALVLGLAACGDDDDTVSTVTKTTTRTSSTSVIETEASGPGITLPGGVTLPGGTLPDLGSLPSLPDLGSILPGGSLPDISIPDLGSLPTNAEEILRSFFPKLNDDQVSCLLDKLGGKIDTTKVLSEIQSCGIDPGDLSPGG